MRKAIIFLKARIPGGAMGDLFAQPVQVAGHTRKDGVFVAPHQSTRLKAPVEAPRPDSDMSESHREWRENYSRVTASPDLSKISTTDIRRAIGFASHAIVHAEGPAMKQALAREMAHMERELASRRPPAAPPPAPERGTDLAGKRATYPDGRMIPQDGDEVFQTVAGPFGMAATLTGVVRGKRVLITGANSMIAGSSSRKTDTLTEHWTVKGDPELARRRAERDAREAAAKAAAEAERAADEARAQALAETRGTLDPATVQIGDVVEDPDGVPHLIAEKHGNELYGHPLGGEDAHRGGLGGDLRGWRKTGAVAPEGSIIVHYDPPDSLAASAMRVRRRQGDAWVPVEWSDEADDYVPIAPPPAAPPQAPPAIRAPEGNREKLLLWAVSRGDRGQAARMTAGDMLAAIANRRFDLAQRAMLTGDQPEANAIMNLAVEGANAEGALANHLDDTRGQAAFDFLAEAMGGTLAETFQAQMRAPRQAKAAAAGPGADDTQMARARDLKAEYEANVARLSANQPARNGFMAKLRAAAARTVDGTPASMLLDQLATRAGLDWHHAPLRFLSPDAPATDAGGRHRAFVAKMKEAGITAAALADFMGEGRARVARRLKDNIPPTPGEVAALDALIAQRAKTAAARLPQAMPPGPPGSIFPAVHQDRLRDLYRDAVYGAGAEPRRAARQRIEALLTETGVPLKEAFERSGLDLAAYFASRPIG